MGITPEQAYKPILGKQPEEMSDNLLMVSESQLRTRSAKDPKNEEILEALNMITAEINKRKPFGSK